MEKFALLGQISKKQHKDEFNENMGANVIGECTYSHYM